MNLSKNRVFNSSKHLMVDIETFSTTKNAAMPSISAVKFCPYTGETFAEFEAFIDVQSQIDAGFDLKADTIFFWMSQSESLRQEMIEKCKYGPSITEVLIMLSKWMTQHSIVWVWGKGPSFDNALLQNAFDRMKMDRPWKFWNEFCVRTFIALDPEVKKLEFIGQLHNGIDDAKHQVRMVSTNIRKINMIDPAALLEAAETPNPDQQLIVFKEENTDVA